MAGELKNNVNLVLTFLQGLFFCGFREELVNETDDNVFKQEEGSVKPKETDRETSDQNQKATETSKYWSYLRTVKL